MASDNSAAAASKAFGTTFAVEPTATHTHTMILLHGRGSDGQEFAEEFLSSQLSDGSTLPENLPNWRWVFPSSKQLWSTAFEEDMPTWFEAHSLTDVGARQGLQMPGIKDSVNHINNTFDEEAAKLEGRTERVVMIGISQGAAVGLWALLCPRAHSERIGAFIGISAWLPFADELHRYSQLGSPGSDENSLKDANSDAGQFVRMMTGSSPSWMGVDRGVGSLLETPLFLGHGTDDAYVDVELGRQARDVLLSLGLIVEWKEYEGAEQEGHWLKEPEETNDIFDFLRRTISA